MSTDQILSQVADECTKAVDACGEVVNTVNGKMGEISGALQSVKDDAQSTMDQLGDTVNQYVVGARDEQSHFRLSKNQLLKVKDSESFPYGWNAGYIKTATLLETVTTGIEPEQRSPLAREFLAAINSDRQHFATNFNIWELEIYPNIDGATKPASFFWQHLKWSSVVTIAAIVKHITGIVPDSFYCHGLRANEPAKLCGRQYQITNHRHGYIHMHPFVRGEGKDLSETTVIQIALPAAVSGYVDLTNNAWGQFAYLGDATESAFDEI
ncbi:hypothetical protein HG263_05555 [Pseudoalteromonas sp. JBTF-M23]|uniref:Uncharacterized protein n=1 Tax=Pseudoalteromonas caenipelagi TaxID=2726988 RepID=A0A849V9H7_9GAMM|nr:hypothetical protein [Pseudoalteromonas caenipelagi]NOU50002.1 hypothetical protein [Pseudoalteromonas caenipelagi]